MVPGLLRLEQHGSGTIFPSPSPNIFPSTSPVAPVLPLSAASWHFFPFARSIYHHHGTEKINQFYSTVLKVAQPLIALSTCSWWALPSGYHLPIRLGSDVDDTKGDSSQRTMSGSLGDGYNILKLRK